MYWILVRKTHILASMKYKEQRTRDGGKKDRNSGIEAQNRGHWGSWYRVTLQMKGRWESNINVWFPFMYSQKWSCFFQNRIVMFRLQFLHSYICERFIYFRDRSAYPAAGKYVDQSWEYINCSQTRECGNWDWGRAIPRKGIHKWDFPCSVGDGERRTGARVQNTWDRVNRGREKRYKETGDRRQRMGDRE